ncbi:hypothetical protein [Tsuneonella sp. SYSU-LHT278]|uniref:hypothetical protein n=1 Tax=Tsuneonella sediminis TaxID=3416089 RepID=UPI003F7B1472
MPFDKNKFARHLEDNALPGFGAGKCAKYVREALVAGGLNTAGNPLSAKDYGPFLEGLGFASHTKTSPYSPEKGDIVVLPANVGSTHGHVAGYVGSKWVSDFVQTDMFGGPSYRKAGIFEVFRYR